MFFFITVDLVCSQCTLWDIRLKEVIFVQSLVNFELMDKKSQCHLTLGSQISFLHEVILWFFNKQQKYILYGFRQSRRLTLSNFLSRIVLSLSNPNVLQNAKFLPAPFICQIQIRLFYFIYSSYYSESSILMHCFTKFTFKFNVMTITSRCGCVTLIEWGRN